MRSSLEGGVHFTFLSPNAAFKRGNTLMSYTVKFLATFLKWYIARNSSGIVEGEVFAVFMNSVCKIPLIFELARLLKFYEAKLF